MTPAISVVLPYRNAARHLEAALESILTQQFFAFELLAIDDGSTDDSASIVARLAQRDERVRTLDAHGAGLPAALNFGIAQARGRYIARMDADDIAFPQRFARQIDALERDDRLVVVGSAIEQIDDAGRFIQNVWFPSSAGSVRNALNGGQCCLCHPTTMIRRDAMQLSGGYRESVPLTEDLDLWLRLSKIGELRNLGERLLQYRLHASSAGLARTQEQIRSMLRSLLLNQSDLSGADRANIETLDANELLQLLGGDATDRLVTLTAWYVENAAAMGAHAQARRMARDIALLAPAAQRRRAERQLLEAGALSAAAHGGKAAALRYTSPRQIGFRRARALWRNVLQPLCVQVGAPPPGRSHADPAGYLDQVFAYEAGKILLLYGWLPLTGRTLPREIRIVLKQAARVESFRLMPRPDVASVFGEDHYTTGFHIVLSLSEPCGADVSVQVWSRCSRQEWRPLHDDATTIDVGDIECVTVTGADTLDDVGGYGVSPVRVGIAGAR